MKPIQGIFIIILAIAIVVLNMSIFTVNQTQQAIVLQLGQPVGAVNGPGLHFKIPFVQSVRYFDNRILSVDPAPEQMVISSHTTDASGTTDKNIKAVKDDAKAAMKDGLTENTGDESDDFKPSIDSVSGEPIIVDTFARYKIIDPLQFMKTLGTVVNANQRLQNILSDATKAVLGKTTLEQLLSPDRTKVMAEIQQRVNSGIKKDQLGIEIVDVRIVRADLTPELRQSTVRRMISQLKERATETRAKGEERALEIRSTAEKERTVIMADAQRTAQGLKGEGDKTAIKIYTSAFNKDKEFYDFTRSLEAYKNTMANPQTRLILSPDGDFFKYFDKE